MPESALQRAAMAARQNHRHTGGSDAIRAVWWGEVDAVLTETTPSGLLPGVYVKVPRLSDEQVHGPLPVAGDAPAPGVRVLVLAVEGRKDNLVVLNPAARGNDPVLLSGPGRPDRPDTTGGVIHGNEPVGTTYTSTDGADTGAWEWKLRPDGWTVTSGETPWVKIPIGSGGQLQVKREGSTVYLSIVDWIFAGVPSGDYRVLFNVPEGFRPPNTFSGTTVARWNHNQQIAFEVVRTGSLSTGEGFDNTRTVRASLNYPTDNAWPLTI